MSSDYPWLQTALTEETLLLSGYLSQGSTNACLHINTLSS